jgi:hypothetical protein
MSSKNRHDLHIQALVNAIALSVAEASDEEILEDARAAGVDLKENAEKLKQMLSETAKRFQKRKFIAAQQHYKTEVERIQHKSVHLPDSPAERRAVLQLVAAQHAQGAMALTAHGRDLESLSDSDVTSLLEELDELGLLSDIKPKQD